jgi:hypothetical protein
MLAAKAYPDCISGLFHKKVSLTWIIPAIIYAEQL